MKHTISKMETLTDTKRKWQFRGIGRDAIALGVSRQWLHQVLEDPSKSRRLTRRIVALRAAQAPPGTVPPPDGWLTPAQIGEHFFRTGAQVLVWRKKGLIPAAMVHQFGKKFFFSPDAITHLRKLAEAGHAPKTQTAA